jgi:murein L,D-transpeptidase YcbB/YkuD
VFTDYVADLRGADAEPLAFLDPAVAPPCIDAAKVLIEAARAPSLERHLASLTHLNPQYDGLRAALVAHRARVHVDSVSADEDERLILRNLDRLRVLPRSPTHRYILIDAASATLEVFEGDRLVDSMPVVVGRRADPTPMMVGLLRYAVVNPYWNVPEDLAQTSIAPQVLAEGPGYLEARGYEVLSDWSQSARLIDPRDVDWSSVAAGRQSLRVRQRPGGRNAMGRIKFMMPNPLGIYLHDNPERDLFRRPARFFSAGCVRLSEAQRLGELLLGRSSSALEQTSSDTRVDLPEPVTVSITYLTAAPGRAGGVVFRDDFYQRDGVDASALNGRRQRFLSRISYQISEATPPTSSARAPPGQLAVPRRQRPRRPPPPE